MPRDAEDPRRCSALTKTGDRCRHAARRDRGVCHIHDGAPVGRPTKLTPEIAGRIEQVMRAGGYPEAAATVAGIGPNTLREWLQRGDPDGSEPIDAPFRTFRARIERARAEAETRNVAIIAQAAAEHWQAAAWLLERRHPERWARPSQRDKEPIAEPKADPSDPFAEVDELAKVRQRRGV